MANSWMKDYYDIWTLCREFAFDGEQKFPVHRSEGTSSRQELSPFASSHRLGSKLSHRQFA